MSKSVIAQYNGHCGITEKGHREDGGSGKPSQTKKHMRLEECVGINRSFQYEETDNSDSEHCIRYYLEFGEAGGKGT